MNSNEGFSIQLLKRLGNDVPKETDKAIAYCHTVAANGNVDAQWILGLFYQYGLGQLYKASVDMDAAREWFEKAAEQGNAEAQLYIGDLYREGDGVPRDSIKAMDMYHRAAAQGNALAMYTLGTYYNKTIGGMEGNIRNMEKDIPKAVEWFEKAAALGYAKAWYEIGLMYKEGYDLVKDFDKALGYFRKAADEEDADAQCEIGEMYENGEGVAEDKEAAIEWYSRAAANGSNRARMRHEAIQFGDTLGGGWGGMSVDGSLPDPGTPWHVRQFNLGELYRVGRAVPKNTEKAVECFTKAAKQGNEAAKQALKQMGHELREEPKDEDEEFNVNIGMVAENNRGYDYHHGEGVAQDYAKALKWYTKAANHGSSVSMRHIGELYYDGLGVAKDATKALEWFEKAAACGDSKAKAELEKIKAGT